MDIVQWRCPDAGILVCWRGLGLGSAQRGQRLRQQICDPRKSRHKRFLELDTLVDVVADHGDCYIDLGHVQAQS